MKRIINIKRTISMKGIISMKRISLLLILAMITVALIGCDAEYQQNQNLQNTQNSAVECASNNDCKRAGCSAQLCIPKLNTDGEENNPMTTCDIKEEYECYEHTSCGCVEGKCNWAQTEEFLSCWDEKSTQ